MTLNATEIVDSQRWASLCNADGEFQIAARHWSGGLRLQMGSKILDLGVINGVATNDSEIIAGPSNAEEPGIASGVVVLSGPEDLWKAMLAGSPPRFHTDLLAALSSGLGLARDGDKLAYAQYYGAIMRAIELLRPTRKAQQLSPAPMPSQFDAPQGRYVHLKLAGLNHRIYFEEAGSGIPVLLQHTAGCHGSQWRHLMEDRRITDHFRLIAYDLPYHGKSLPPTEKDWWAQRYELRGDF